MSLKPAFTFLGVLLTVVFSIEGAQWSPANNGLLTLSPDINALAQCGDVLLAGTDGKGIFRSTDGGENWFESNTGIHGYKYIICMTSGGGYVFAGTRDDGIFRSSDTGKTWISISDFTYTSWVNSLLYSSGTLYAGLHENGLLRSVDNGYNWECISDGIPDSAIEAIAIMGDTLFAGTFRSGLFKSNVTTISWKPISIGLPSSYGTIAINAIAVQNETILVGLFLGNGVYRSDDHGETWINSSAGLPADEFEAFEFAVHGDSVYVCGRNSGFYLSDNGGETWQDAAPGIPAIYPAVFSALVTDSHVYMGCGNDWGIYKTQRDSHHWVKSNYGLGTIHVTELVSHKDKLFACAEGGLFVSDDHSSTWSQITGINKENEVYPAVLGVTHFAAGNTQYYTCYNSGWYRSDSTLQTWTHVRNSDLYLSSVEITDNSIFMGIDGGVRYWMGNEVSGSWTDTCAVYQSRDNGITWVNADNGLNVVHLYDLVSFGDKLIAATGADGIYTAEESAPDWKPDATFPDTVIAKSLARYGSTILAGTGGDGVFMQQSSTGTWVAFNKGIELAHVRSIATNGSSVCISADEGIFIYNNITGAWENVSTGITDSIITTLTLDDKYLYCGTEGTGVWRCPLPGSSIVIGNADHRAIEKRPSLSLSHDHLDFTAAHGGFATFQLFDMQGRLVKTLFRGHLEKGQKRIYFSAKNLPAANYIVKAGMDGSCIVQKLTYSRFF